jgi:hypothetical protein
MMLALALPSGRPPVRHRQDDVRHARRRTNVSFLLLLLLRVRAAVSSPNSGREETMEEVHRART